MNDDQQQAALGGQPEPEPPETPPQQQTRHRLGRRPQKSAGVYMVLAAPLEGNPDDGPPAFLELGWYRAHGDDHAKRQAVADIEAGQTKEDIRDALKEALHEGGVILHPVPARSWPVTKPTRYNTPAPRLEIG